MNSDKSPKKSSKESSRLSIDSNSTPPPNFQLPPEYWWNSSIPKNNLGSFDEDSQFLSSTPSGYIPDDGTFSPRPSNFKYTANLQSHYPPSTLDWGEPSFDVDDSESSIPEKIPMKDKNVPAQNNVPIQNNIPAQDNDLQYQDIDIWDDNIVNQLHLNNSLFNDESSSHDAANIHQNDVPSQHSVSPDPYFDILGDDEINQLSFNNSPLNNESSNFDESDIYQEYVPAQNNVSLDPYFYMWSDDEISQLSFNNSPLNNESSNCGEIDTHQEGVSAPTSAQAPVPTSIPDSVRALIPTSIPDSVRALIQVPNRTPVRAQPLPSFLVPVPAPTIQINDQQYVFDSLENTFKYWVSNAGFSESTKSSYISTTMGFIKLLDIYGKFYPSQETIDFYRDNYFEKDKLSRIKNFKSASNNFFEWIKDNEVYNRIVPHKDPAPDRKVKLINMTLSNLLKRWYKTLKTNRRKGRAYVSNFITYLIEISSPHPTIENIKTYFKNNPKLMSPSKFGECKAAIKNFLQFTESRGMVQRHDVYEFLDSNEPM